MATYLKCPYPINEETPTNKKDGAEEYSKTQLKLGQSSFQIIHFIIIHIHNYVVYTCIIWKQGL